MNKITRITLHKVLALSACLFFTPVSLVTALDLNGVVVQEKGYSLTNQHILAFFAFLQTSGTMGDEPSQEEVNEATKVAKQTFKQNPKLFVKRMEEILGVKPLAKKKNPTNNKVKSNLSGYQKGLQQEAQNFYPQYKLRFKSADINTLFSVVNGVRFSNLNTKTRRSGKFSMTTDLREEIHFCNNGKLYMVNHSKSAGGGEKALFSSGSNGGEITVDAKWGLAQLPNQSLILMLKMGQAPVTLLPILSDRVNIQMDNKVFSVAGKAGC